MKVLESIFIEIFAASYLILNPLFKNPVLATYTAILVLHSSIAFYLYKWIHRNIAAQKNNKSAKFVLLVIIELLLIGFLCWYIFVYFPTFKALK